MIQKKYFDRRSYETPVQVDYDRKVNYDDEGNEIVSYVKSDYPSYAKSLGTSDLWSLNNLLKSGVNPDFHISTSFNSRLDSVGAVADAVESINKVLDSVETNVETNVE